MVEANIPATHHASASIHCIMNGICGDKSTGIIERNLNYNKIMNMLEVVTNDFLGMLGVTIMNDKISCSSNAYFVGHMRG